MKSKRSAVIGIPACVRNMEQRPFHGVGERYIQAVALDMHAIPFIIPAIGHCYECNTILDHLDGLLITGSQSMVDPVLYGEDLQDDSYLLDPKRDSTSLPLIRLALRRNIPLLCICRGIQDLNVALGGTLHQSLHMLPNTLEHRDRGLSVSPDVRFGPAHKVRLEPNGTLAKLSPIGHEFWVNSLHTQAIKEPGTGVIVEARAPDGIIEAVRVDGQDFAVGVQWHPEWRIAEHPFYHALFQGFLEACDVYHETKKQQAPDIAPAVT